MSKEKSELDNWHTHHILFGDRTLYIGSGAKDFDRDMDVDHNLSENVIKNLHILDKKNDAPITVIVNCSGGDVNHGFAIFDAIRECKNSVTTIGKGSIASMGSIIFQAGDTRIMSKHCKMMIHPIHIQVSGNIYEIEKTLKIAKEEYDDMLEIYLSRIKQAKPRFSKAQLEDKIRFRWDLNYKEAIEYGLCDRLLE